MKIRSFFRFLRKALLTLMALLLLIVIGSNLIIVVSTNNKIFDQIKDLPDAKVAIVLGTSRSLQNGTPNPYFHYRISKAAELYHSGKIEFLIVSGDNRTRYYNEPEQMRRELVKLAVPDSVIYSDYAGLRTLDSMVRSKKIFGQDSIIVVSQKFHNQRAVFLAQRFGIYAVGLNAKDIDARSGIRTQFREIFARVKVFLDLLLQKQPRHLGEEVRIGKGF